LEDSVRRDDPIAKEHDKLDKQLIDKTLKLNELARALQDKNKELASTVTRMNSQNTELVKKTIELNDIKATLEDRNFELEEANKEVTALMQARTDFINKSAHDLRTPITPILALLPTIKARVTDKNLLYDIEVIERNAHNLKQIADNLISYLKSQSGQYEYNFRTTDFTGLLKDMLKTYDELLKQKNIKLVTQLEKLPHIELDELKISEVLQNMLSNAAKFTKPKGIVAVSASANRTVVRVSVKDSGIGMTKTDLQKIFHDFYKADKSRGAVGAGLGLVICREIIEKHHGRIWAQSDGRGKGSSILFEIPIRQEENNGSKSKEKSRA
jgi:signal transduction histidine kinase